MPQKKGKRNLSLLYYFVSECKQALLRAIITVRILAPHLQTIKMTEIAAHPLLFQQLPSEILPHPLQEKSAKFFFHNYSTVKVKRQNVWLRFWIPHCGRCGFRIPGNGGPDSLSVEFGFRIPIVFRIPDNSSWITDSKAQDAGSHKQKSEKKNSFSIPQAKIPDSGIRST
ncbi:unnamed protein product [Porites evermanni]|uniref:Uncharacterized protein n=1 Tax=Porites evermanni TaxID=104178 RepID=A0ABN8RZD5_9CNID|nr:unnamed protein product [Porites evermanni]